MGVQIVVRGVVSLDTAIRWERINEIAEKIYSTGP